VVAASATNQHVEDLQGRKNIRGKFRGKYRLSTDEKVIGQKKRHHPQKKDGVTREKGGEYLGTGTMKKMGEKK